MSAFKNGGKRNKKAEYLQLGGYVLTLLSLNEVVPENGRAMGDTLLFAEFQVDKLVQAYDKATGSSDWSKQNPTTSNREGTRAKLCWNISTVNGKAKKPGDYARAEAFLCELNGNGDEFDAAFYERATGGDGDALRGSRFFLDRQTARSKKNALYTDESWIYFSPDSEKAQAFLASALATETEVLSSIKEPPSRD